MKKIQIFDYLKKILAALYKIISTTKFGINFVKSKKT